jgi:hypothetical protein
MADRLDLLLGLLLDKAAKIETERGLSDIGDSIESIGKSAEKITLDKALGREQVESVKNQFTNIAGTAVAAFNAEVAKKVNRFSDLLAGKDQDYNAFAGETGPFADIARNVETVYKLEKQASERVSTTRDLAKEQDRAAKSTSALAAENEKLNQKWEDARIELEPYSKKLDEATTKTEQIEQSTRRASDALNDTEYESTSKELLKYVDALDQENEQYNEQISKITELNRLATDIGQISAILAGAGAAIVGGIAVSAQQYVGFVEQAGIQGDETADRWIAATKRVKNAQLNLGQASAEVLLPVYEKAAELAEKAAAFVQENPDLVQAALNTGLVVATLGAVGVAVSKGIKLYADFKYLAATAEYSLATTRFQNSVREFLAGSALPGGGGVSGAVKGAGAAGLVAGGAGIAAGIAGFAGSFKLADYLRNEGGAPIADLFTSLAPLLGPAGPLVSAGANAEKLFDALQKLTGSAEEAENAVENIDSGLRDFNQEATQTQATGAFIQYRQQEQQAEEQYMAQRAQIVEQGARQIAQIESNYTKQRTRLIEQFAASSAQAVANFEFSQRQAEEQFAFSEAQAVRDFNEQRAEAREEFQRDEQRSREDHLREMRKLAEDHQDRLRDLAIARDALGIIDENRDYARRRQDAESEYRTDSQRRRQDFQRQQQEREQEFQQERARRRQEFEFRQQQALEQFERQQKLAREQFEERLEQLDEEHEAELALARRNTAEKLRQLQEQYREEQIARRNAFYDILRDLDANLLNEKNLRAQYYERMQQDLMNFLESTAGAAGSNLPGYPTETHQAGGYGPGYVGAGEFVTSRSTTRMLEGLVGGRLTQRSFAQVVARGGGGVTLNDQRRFYGSISNEERRMIQEDTQDLLENIHGII